MVRRTSDQLIQDFYKGEARRYKMLFGMTLIVLVFVVAGFFWLRAEQRKSNERLENIGNSLQTYIEGYDKRVKKRDTALQGQREKLLESMSCLFKLHDASQLTPVAAAKCKSIAEHPNATESMLPPTSESSPESSKATTEGTKQKQKPTQTKQPTPPPKPNVVQRAVNGIGDIISNIRSAL